MSGKDKITPALQAQLLKVLEEQLKLPENRECVDCGSKAPRWASTNLGVFMCIRCSGIHRALGVHISKVKSVSLDKWTPEQVEFMQRMGNAKGKETYESYVPSTYNKGDIRTENIALEQWIRDKYEFKRFMSRDGAEPVNRREYKEQRGSSVSYREPNYQTYQRESPREYQREPPREYQREPAREYQREAPREQPRAPVSAAPAPRVPGPIKPRAASNAPAPITAPAPAAQQSFDLVNWDEPAAPAPQPANDLFGDFATASTPSDPQFNANNMNNMNNAPPQKDKNAILMLYNTPQAPMYAGPMPGMMMNPGMMQGNPGMMMNPGMMPGNPGMMANPGMMPGNYPVNYNMNMGPRPGFGMPNNYGAPMGMQPNYGMGMGMGMGMNNMNMNMNMNPQPNNLMNGMSNMNFRM